MTSYREMEELNRVKSKVLNHLSHELRTPLAIIKGTVVTMWRKLKEQKHRFIRPRNAADSSPPAQPQHSGGPGREHRYDRVHVGTTPHNGVFAISPGNDGPAGGIYP